MINKPATEIKAEAEVKPGNPYWRGRLSMVDFIILTSLDQLISRLNYLNEKVDCTEPSHSVSVPR